MCTDHRRAGAWSKGSKLCVAGAWQPAAVLSTGPDPHGCGPHSHRALPLSHTWLVAPADWFARKPFTVTRTATVPQAKHGSSSASSWPNLYTPPRYHSMPVCGARRSGAAGLGALGRETAGAMPRHGMQGGRSSGQRCAHVEKTPAKGRYAGIRGSNEGAPWQGGGPGMKAAPLP